MATLTEMERIALADGDAEAAARARAELGYVDFLRARYDRAERWLTQVLDASEVPSTRAKAMTYLGSVASDRADYPQAVAPAGGGDLPVPRAERAASRGVRAVHARPDQPAAR